MPASTRSVLVLLCLALCTVLSSAQTTVYFFAQSPSGIYPATCTTGSLSCSTNSTSGGYSCNGGTLSGGVHYYYPSATSFTFNSSLLVGQPATVCEQYAADYQVPLTTNGLNIQYGIPALPVCVNYRVRNTTTGAITADPDAVEAYPLTFNYSTIGSALPTCPTPNIAPTSSAATVYFTYLGLNGTASSTICGSGSLNCSSYGNNQYYCTSLNSGTHYMYNSSTGAYMSVALTSEVECNGFGDGYLPLDYEGISLAGAFSSTFNCISWYGSSGGSGYDFYSSGSLNSYTSYSGSQSFTYGTTATTALSACSAYIPGLASGASNQTSSSSSSSSTGAQQSSAYQTSYTSMLLLLATLLSALAMLL